VKKEEKSPFFCKLHGSGQGHNTIGCEVINGQIDKLKPSEKVDNLALKTAAQTAINKPDRIGRITNIHQLCVRPSN
jgi:hypothetical protein